MRLEPFVEIFTPDDPIVHGAGGGVTFAGRLLRDVLREHGGRYEAVTELPDRDRDSILRMAERTANSGLAAQVSTNKFMVSLEHLRHLDPDTTRIVYGLHLHHEPGDSETPSFGP
jgi:hypothetical protein